jgi:CubicO group peptidase (beta-lactamase class C family)
MSSFPLAYAPSETVGFLPERLERLTEAMARQIEEKRAPGVAMLIARHGKVAYRQRLGALRPDGPAMRDDAIFRIYSMTKPIVSVAAMTLVEEGRLSIADPVSNYVPAFANPNVGIERDGEIVLMPAKRSITVQDLLRHTSGLTYGFTGTSAVQKLIFAANIFDLSKPTSERVETLAVLPLQHQPCEVWEYGHSTDVLGRLVEVVAEGSLGDVLRHRIFDPLGMCDTAFYTPAAKLDRRAEPFSFDLAKTIGQNDTIDVTAPPAFEMGGTGLVSTLDDYARFAAMLMNGGELDGARILGRRTLAFMASDHLDAKVDRNNYPLWPGHGFGLGFAVRTAPGLAPAPGRIGEYFWGGVMGTAFWVSPRDSLFAVLMVQSLENREYFRVLFRNLVSAAIA